MVTLLLFVAAFCLAVFAVYTFARSEDTANVSLLNLINDTRAKNDKFYGEQKTLIEGLTKEITGFGAAQETLKTACLAAVDEKTKALVKRIDDVTKENEILKVRLASVDKRFRELPKTVLVKVEGPVEVDVLRKPKPVGQGKNSLLRKSGLLDPKGNELNAQ